MNLRANLKGICSEHRSTSRQLVMIPDSTVDVSSTTLYDFRETLLSTTDNKYDTRLSTGGMSYVISMAHVAKYHNKIFVLAIIP